MVIYELPWWSQHCKQKLILELFRGRSRNFWLGGPNFGSLRTVELFCGKLLLIETTTCFSICEHQLPLAREILLCEQRQTDHRRVPKKQLHFLIFLEFSLVTKCSACFIKKISWLQTYWCKNFGLKQVSGLTGGSGPLPPPLDLPLLLHSTVSLVKLVSHPDVHVEVSWLYRPD